MRACTASHWSVEGLRCCVPIPSLRLSVHFGPTRRFQSGNRTHSLHRLGPSLFLVPRLSQIYENQEISRRGEDGWRTTEHFGSQAECVCEGVESVRRNLS